MNVLLQYNKICQRLCYMLCCALLSGMTYANDSGTGKNATRITDPTAPLLNLSGGPLAPNATTEQKKTAVALILQGVLLENGRTIAVVNNQLVSVGDVIEGYKVISIAQYSAQLESEEQRLSLFMSTTNVKVNHE